MNIYLLVLSGQGDTDVKPVDEEAYNWITSEDLGRPETFEEDEDEHGWYDRIVPASQLELLQKDADKFGGEVERVYITIGSYDNDRALFAKPVEGYATHDSVADAIKEITAKGDTLVDSYEGCIY